MNEVIKVINKRASCRFFSNREIGDSVLDEILKAGLRAPTGGDLQPFSIIKIRDEDKKKRLAEMSRNQKYIYDAPVDLLFCIDWSRIKRMSHIEPCPMDMTDSFFDYTMSIIDLSLCSQNICIAAESLGLKSIHIGNIFNNLDEISDMFGLPDHVVPVMIMCVGYPKSEPTPVKKYPLDIVVHEEVYRVLSDKELKESFRDRYDDWGIKLSQEKTERFIERCEEYGGAEFREKAETQLEKEKRFNFYQFWLGVFYDNADEGMKNIDYRDFMEKKGFGWLNYNR